MAQLNLSKSIVDLISGKAVPDLTIGKAIIQGLTANNPNDNLSGQQKFDRYRLALRCTDADSAEFTVEELAIIKSAVGAVFGPIVVGPVFNEIETMSTGDGENKPPRP